MVDDDVVEAWTFDTVKKGRQKSSDYVPFFEFDLW